jgi:hypothetical protein
MVLPHLLHRLDAQRAGLAARGPDVGREGVAGGRHVIGQDVDVGDDGERVGRGGRTDHRLGGGCPDKHRKGKHSKRCRSHGSSTPVGNRPNCGAGWLGAARPRCVKACGVSSRPRGVRCSRPRWMR